MDNHTRQFETVWWEGEAVCMIDQRLLPGQLATIVCRSVEDVARAIKTMQVRGAPAIGCAAAYGMAIAASGPPADAVRRMRAAKLLLDSQRPTAVNLAWATERVLTAALASDRPAAAALSAAHAILAEDLAMCHAIGDHGAPLIPPRGNVLTHCNAGGLATAGYGTALAPIRSAHAAGRPIHVYADETRPVLQGARLTAWELLRDGIPTTLIVDSAAGWLMARGMVDCVLVGADRVAANGDCANKIGTYSLAVLAKAHGVPFYVAAPTSTIDLTVADGTAIPIEERDADELTTIAGTRIAPEGVAVFNPAFDVTPHALIAAIITERGAALPPYGETLAAMVSQAGAAARR